MQGQGLARPGGLRGQRPEREQRQARPDYARMLTDIRAGRIDAVVVAQLDRLHRRPIELEEFINLADEKHLALACVSGDVDLATDDGRFMARVMGAVARKEMERKCWRFKRAAEQRAETGEQWWSVRPFGFERQPILDDKGNAEGEQARHRAVEAGTPAGRGGPAS